MNTKSQQQMEKQQMEKQQIEKLQKESDREKQDLLNRFEFRSIRQEEIAQTIEIEQICFPPNEACSAKQMSDRIKKLPELFFVAVDKETGRIAGFLNGLSTNEEVFRDEFFTDAGLYDPKGKNVMLLGLDVLPEYRGQGLATELMKQYQNKERENGRSALFLTCHDSKIKMYEKMGFKDLGISGSTWGGEVWYDMSCEL